MADLSFMKDLREQMAKIATEARSKLDEVTDNTPEERAAEIEREFDAMMSDHDKIRARVEREERLAKAKDAIDLPDTSKVPVVEGRTAPAVDNGLVMDYRRAVAEMMANEEYVSAPPFLNDVPDAYAIVMPADTMEPRYRAGDTLYVNPEILPTNGDDVVIHIQFKNRACAIIREVIKLEGVFFGEHDEPIPAYAVLSLSEKEELRRKYIKKEGRDPIDDPLVFAEVAEWFVINAEEGLHGFIEGEGEGIEVEPKKAIIDAHVVVGSQRKRFMEKRRHVHMEIKDSISVTANVDAVTVKTSNKTVE